MLGFISGCFDGPNCAHKGHEYIITQAKKVVDTLIAAVNDDNYIIRNKGRKPCRTAEDRAKKLLTLGVDKSIIFTEDGPLRLILEYKPDYIFVGDDYPIEKIVGFKECQEWGGQVVIIKRLPNISTTELINEQRKRIKAKAMPG